jgi:hypothetical protein
MDENENKSKIEFDAEELKNETKDTVKQVKETIKKVDIKKDSKETKNFLKEMFSDPFQAVKDVAEEKENVFSKAIVLMIVYIAASIIAKIISLIKYGKYYSFGTNFMDLISSILNPVFYIAVPAIIVFLYNRKNKKPLTTVISTLVISNVTMIISEIVSIITVLVSGISIITSPISTVLSAIAIILTYVGMKTLFGEDENKAFIKKYAIIEFLVAIVLIILARIGIY